MRTCAKKTECVNEPIGPFTTFSHCAYGYNVRGEVVFSRRDEMHRRSSASEGRFGVAEPEGCASICKNAEETYSCDDIGNLVFNTFGAITNIYFSNSRNQYTSNLCASPLIGHPLRGRIPRAKRAAQAVATGVPSAGGYASLREINWNTMGSAPIVFLNIFEANWGNLYFCPLW